MDKHAVSPENRKLGVHFANAVTIPVTCERPNTYTIGRSGEHSVFDVFTRCFRRSTRDNSRTGLSLIEMNKELEMHGFTKVRIRQGKKLPQKDQGEALSSFRYSSRRWRDPDDIHDLRHLQAVWPDVNKDAKVPCPLDVVLGCLRGAVAESRQRNSEKVKGKSQRDKSKPQSLDHQALLFSPAGSSELPSETPTKDDGGSASAQSFADACGDTSELKEQASIDEHEFTDAVEGVQLPSVVLDQHESANADRVRRTSTLDCDQPASGKEEDLEGLLLAVSDPAVDWSSNGAMSLLSDPFAGPNFFCDHLGRHEGE